MCNLRVPSERTTAVSMWAPNVHYTLCSESKTAKVISEYMHRAKMCYTGDDACSFGWSLLTRKAWKSPEFPRAGHL